MDSIYGSTDYPNLGEFVLIGYDSPPDSNTQQIVVAASYKVSNQLSSINLYKLVNGQSLTLWQQDALLISTADIGTLTFESGMFMYIESST